MDQCLYCSLIVEIMKLLFSLQWYKGQKSKKPERILHQATPSKAIVSQSANVLSQSSKSENLGDLKAALTGLSRDSRVRNPPPPPPHPNQFLFNLVGYTWVFEVILFPSDYFSAY